MAFTLAGETIQYMPAHIISSCPSFNIDERLPWFALRQPIHIWYLQVKMVVTVIVRATYTEERALADFFTQTFGVGSCTILVSVRSCSGRDSCI
jgi:hypothetical protein